MPHLVTDIDPWWPARPLIGTDDSATLCFYVEDTMDELIAQREVEFHKDTTGGANDVITITVGADFPDKAPWQYGLTYPTKEGDITDEIVFWHGTVEGVTNEAVLAVVLDRLNCFQASSHACQENDMARHHVQMAIDLLKMRSIRLARPDSMVAVPAPAGPCRITLTGVRLTVGAWTGDVELLRRAQGAWNTVEDALRRFTPLPTSEEWAVLEAIATTETAQSGLATVKAEMARIRKS